MNKISFFCLTLDPLHEDKIKKLSYIPVGLGKNNFSKNTLQDKDGKNISKKNPFYGEYTFHYWVWKNYLDRIKTDWVGFCQYRKFFVKNNLDLKEFTFEKLNQAIIKNVDTSYINYDAILGEKFFVDNYKISKIFKNHLSKFLLNPSLFFLKKKRNLRLHFELFHGKKNLQLAINLLDEENKESFKNFMNNEISFNPHNMFICKKEILKGYYEIVFPWLEKCETVFGFNNLDSYGLKRIYGFLAERFLSYWFQKNYRVKELPIIVKSLSDYKNL
jgi:hypothetical protein